MINLPKFWAFSKPFEPSHDEKNSAEREKKKSHMKQRFAGPALSAASLLGVLLADGHVLHDVVGGAHGHGRPLVDARRLDVQDVLVARGGHAARLLHDEGHRDALVQQPQLQGRRRRWVSVLGGRGSSLSS